MKAFYLTLAIIFTVLILLLSFGNISASCSNMHFLFFNIDSTNPTIISLTIAVIGIITGLFYGAFIHRVMKSPEDEDDEF